MAGLPACAQRSETGEAKPCVGLDTGDEANTLPRRGSDGEQLMERRTFLLGLMGGLAAATGLVSTGTTPAEASPPQSTRGAEGLEIADLNPEKLDGVTVENTQYYRRRARRVYRRYYRRPARRYYRRARRY